MKTEVKKDQIAYAIYFLPGSEEMQLIAGLAEEVSTLIDGERLKSGFVFAPYEENKQCPRIIIRSQALISGEEAIVSSFGKVSAACSQRDLLDGQACMSQADYETAVAELLHDLSQDDKLGKAVLSRAKEWPLPTNFPLLDFLKRLKKYLPEAFCFLVCTPQAGLWIGATPEPLLKVKGKHAYTQALAGTLAADGEDQWSEKELVEQKIVSDYIAENLRKVGVEDCQQSEVKTIQSGAVKHLKTSFKFNIEDDLSIAKVIETLHPTPAVCGVPLAAAKAAIKKFEKAPRQYYTGYLGPLGIGDESHLFVNLRSMHLNAHKAILYVGAGITVDSVPEKEWLETQAKAQTLLNVIQ